MNVIESVRDLARLVSRGIDDSAVDITTIAALLSIVNYEFPERRLKNGLSILLLGESTESLKSTVIEIVKESITMDDAFSEASSKKFVDGLVHDKSAVLLKDEISDEFTQWINGSRGKEGFFQLMCVCITGKSIEKMKYKSWSIDRLSDYKFSAIMATTYEGLETMQKSDEMLLGGFAFRLLYFPVKNCVDWKASGLRWTIEALEMLKNIKTFIDLVKRSRLSFTISISDSMRNEIDVFFNDAKDGRRDAVKKHIMRLVDVFYEIAIASAIDRYLATHEIRSGVVPLNLENIDITIASFYVGMSCLTFQTKFDDLSSEKMLAKARKKLRENHGFMSERAFYHALGISKKQADDIIILLVSTGEVEMHDSTIIFSEYEEPVFVREENNEVDDVDEPEVDDVDEPAA